MTAGLRSMYLQNTEYSEIDASDPDRVTLLADTSVLEAVLVAGATPLELVRHGVIIFLFFWEGVWSAAASVSGLHPHLPFLPHLCACTLCSG